MINTIRAIVIGSIVGFMLCAGKHSQAQVPNPNNWKDNQNGEWVHESGEVTILAKMMPDGRLVFAGKGLCPLTSRRLYAAAVWAPGTAITDKAVNCEGEKTTVNVTVWRKPDFVNNLPKVLYLPFLTQVKND